MSVAFPEVRVGDPVRYESLSVFPLFAGSSLLAGLESPVEYLLSDEGIGSGTVTVEEVSEGGSVPDLLVENKGDLRVLFLEGEELVGAKQNRVLNTSVLIAAKSKVKIPVSCVEAGRWAYKSRHFGSGGTHSPSKLRWLLKTSVSASLRQGGSHTSDQGKVWAEVARQQASLGTSSGTRAMADTFENYKERVVEFQDKLKYVDGASGVAVAVGKKIVAVDMFDKASTCQKVWNRLLSGFVLDALETKSEEIQVSDADVQKTLNTTGGMSWVKAEPVGEGEEYRAESGGKVHASALTFHEAPVHLSVVTAG